MNADPRGPVRTITRVEEDSGPTMITKSCGHRSAYANHFTYKVGAPTFCFQCGQASEQREQNPIRTTPGPYYCNCGRCGQRVRHFDDKHTGQWIAETHAFHGRPCTRITQLERENEQLRLAQRQNVETITQQQQAIHELESKLFLATRALPSGDSVILALVIVAIILGTTLLCAGLRFLDEYGWQAGVVGGIGGLLMLAGVACFSVLVAGGGL